MFSFARRRKGRATPALILAVFLVLGCAAGVRTADVADFPKIDSFNEIEDYAGPTTETRGDFELAGGHRHDEAKFLVCPDIRVKRNFYTIPCDSTKDCQIAGGDLLCCESRCVKGIYAEKLEEQSHQPLFGIVDRICPEEPIAEVFSTIKTCKSDGECSPRICCPEKNGPVKYCRTGIPKLDRLPGAKQFAQPFKNFISYMQCTPPPPAFLDLFPKPCRTQFDCFPNLCCQEGGKRFCRPAKRSILALFATFTQRLGQSEATRRFISRITT